MRSIIIIINKLRYGIQLYKYKEIEIYGFRICFNFSITKFNYFFQIYLQIFLLLFILLYVGSFALIGRFRRRDKEDLCSTDDDEILVYKIR